jgi:hypothetical protein
VSDSQVYQLAQVYFGNLVSNRKQVSDTPGVIARTPDITPTQVNECLSLARLAPPSPSETAPEMPGALGLFRGETIDFILARSQRNDAGYPQLQCVLAPIAPLRALGGNALALRALGMAAMPSFATTNPNLAPFELRDPRPPTSDEQTDAMLNLLLYCEDKFQNVESILAALVQGWPLAIVNSPPSLEKRLQFTQGLLSLLPIPARIGITFATHVRDPLSSQVQIKFLSESATPPQHVAYDWGSGKFLTPVPEDSYSHYIIAQLRLDPSLVIEQTEQLSRTAVWRAMRKENLGRALAWVSRRAAVDGAVREGQPADRETVAAILREDPTLSDDLRQVYARHLLAFALALNEPESADVIPTVCITNQNVAKTVVEQLLAAIENERAAIVYALVERWLLRISEAVDLQWHNVLHAAAKQRLSDLFSQRDLPQTLEFMRRIQQAPPVLRFKEVVPDLVQLALSAARANPDLAREVFLMGIGALPAGDLYRLLNDEKFREQLPPEAQTALSYLEPEARQPVPPQVLDQAARVFGDGQRMLVLTRLVEWALYLQRIELIDTGALQALLVIVQSPQAEDFGALVQQAVDELSEVSILQTLKPPGPRILVQLLLQIGQYGQAIGQLEFYQNAVFGPDRLKEFAQLAGEVFRMTALAPEALTQALAQLEGSQIRPEPRAVIYTSSLVNRQWAKDQDYAARRLTTMIFNDNSLIAIIGHENTLKLLDFYARPKNALDTLRVAAALVDHTLHLGAEGAALIARMWPSITWNAEVADAAVELLRRFARGVSPTETPTLVAYFERELGPEISEMLQATRLVRQAIAAADLMKFADNVSIATQLFIDIASVYHTNKELPPTHRLRHDLDTMTGGLSEQERRQVADNTFDITRQIYELGQQSARRRGKPLPPDALIQGQTMPQNGLDLLRFIGGHVAQHQSLPFDLEREEMGHIFGSRSAAMFLRETTAITQLLSDLQAAFDQQNTDLISPKALGAELDSLWSGLSLYNQRQIRESFALNCQQLAEVIQVMAEGASDRLLSDSGIGSQLETGQRQPRTALETLRWINGYFARKHIRTRT